MKKLFIIFFYFLCFIASADNNQIVLRDTKHQHDHFEYYPPADMPEVYYDSDNLEIMATPSTSPLYPMATTPL